MPALSVTATGPASCASLLWRRAGVPWATVIVKATFRLVPGQVAELVPPLPVAGVDRLSSAGTGSLAEAAETAPHLPGAGVILTGHACAPRGRAVPSLAVRLGLAGDRRLLDKTLHVYGDCPAGTRASAQPFTRMPLVWERAYGGPSVPENPAGVGPSNGPALANVVDAADPRRPGGFGPVARGWPARRRLLGGIDAEALGAGVLEIPEGIEWRYFHAAPADQQIEALRGNEWIVLDGMSPELPRVESRLPDVRVHAEWQAGGPARALDLTADTLVIDADRMLCSVVWRGRFRLEALEAASGVRVTARVTRGAEARGRGSALAATVDPEEAKVRRAALPFVTKAPAASEIPAPTALPAADPEVREKVVARLRAGRVLHGLDLAGADLRGLDLSGALLLGLDLRRADLRGARMAKANLVAADLREADLTEAVLAGADLSCADLSGAVLARADMEGAVVKGAKLDGERR
jgi:hypothetical protein